MKQQKVEEEEEYAPLEAAERLKAKGERQKEYKTPVLFLRKSKAGEHLYAYNRVKEDGGDSILGGDVGSLLLNVSEVVALLNGKMDWVKVSVMPPREEEGD